MIKHFAARLANEQHDALSAHATLLHWQNILDLTAISGLSVITIVKLYNQESTLLFRDACGGAGEENKNFA
jgi:hypothetical protein